MTTITQKIFNGLKSADQLTGTTFLVGALVGATYAHVAGLSVKKAAILFGVGIAATRAIILFASELSDNRRDKYLVTASLLPWCRSLVISVLQNNNVLGKKMGAYLLMVSTAHAVLLLFFTIYYRKELALIKTSDYSTDYPLIQDDDLFKLPLPSSCPPNNFEPQRSDSSEHEAVIRAKRLQRFTSPSRSTRSRFDHQQAPDEFERFALPPSYNFTGTSSNYSQVSALPKLIEQIADWNRPGEYDQFEHKLQEAFYYKNETDDTAIIRAIEKSWEKTPARHKADVFTRLLEFQESSIVQESPILSSGLETIITHWMNGVEKNTKSFKESVEELETHLTNQPNGKEQLTEVINRAYSKEKLFTGYSSPEISKLREKLDTLSSSALVPKISETILQDSKTKIDLLKKTLESLTTSENCKTLTDFVTLDCEKSKIEKELDLLKKELVDQMTKLGIPLRAGDLCYFDKQTDRYYPSALSSICNPLDILLKNRGENLGDVALIDFLEKKYSQVDYGGIGDCLFRAFGKVRTTGESKETRDAVVAHMKNNEERFQPLVAKRLKEDAQHAIPGVKEIKEIPGKQDKSDFSCYLEWMKKDTSYGGDPEVQAFSDMKTQTLVVVQKNDYKNLASMIIPLVSSQKEPIPFINLGQNHFCPLFPKESALVLSRNHDELSDNEPPPLTEIFYNPLQPPLTYREWPRV